MININEVNNNINEMNRLMAEAEVVAKFGRDHWITQMTVATLEEFRKLERALSMKKK